MKISCSGFVQQTLAALEKIWKLPNMLVRLSTAADSAGTGVDVEYDGLNALTCNVGLGPAFLLTEDG